MTLIPYSLEKKLEAGATIIFGAIIISIVFGSGDFVHGVIDTIRNSDFKIEGYKIQTKYIFGILGIFFIWIGLNPN